MARTRRVLLPFFLLLASTSGPLTTAGASIARAPRAVPCYLALEASNEVSCYPASAVARLREFGLGRAINPVPTIKGLTHLRLLQLMRVGPPKVSVPALQPYTQGEYFPFGKYVHPDIGIPSTSPVQPKWLVLIEAAAVDTPGSVVETRPWSGGPDLYSRPTDVQSIEARARDGNRSLLAVSNEPVSLLKKVLLALLAADR